MTPDRRELLSDLVKILVSVIITGAVFWFTIGREQDRRNDRQDFQLESLTRSVGDLRAITGQLSDDVRDLVVETRVLVTRVDIALPLGHGGADGR